MTVISDRITDLAGTAEVDSIAIFATGLRENAAGTALVTTTRHDYIPDEDGVITTDDLDPGHAQVRIGMKTYAIDIPDYATPITLWPLIQAGLEIDPTEQQHAVVNAGGVARALRITESAYLALTTKDPDTLYVVVEG